MEQVLGQQTGDNGESPLDNLIRQMQSQQNALGQEPSPDRPSPDPAGRPQGRSRGDPTVGPTPQGVVSMPLTASCSVPPCVDLEPPASHAPPPPPPDGEAAGEDPAMEPGQAEGQAEGQVEGQAGGQAEGEEGPGEGQAEGVWQVQNNALPSQQATERDLLAWSHRTVVNELPKATFRLVLTSTALTSSSLTSTSLTSTALTSALLTSSSLTSTALTSTALTSNSLTSTSLTSSSLTST